MKRLVICLLLLVGFSSGSNAYADTCLPCLINQEIKTLTPETHNLNPHVLALALKAYTCAKAKNMTASVRPVLTIIDYSLPSTEKRLWVFDLLQEKVLFNALVAHGKDTGEDMATQFSDKMGSEESSLGLFLTESTYAGKHAYEMKIAGLERGFNDRAEARHIVMHAGWYVSENFIRLHNMLGRSWGCPAVSPDVVVPIINTIKNGTLLFAYYPDSTWLQQSEYLHCPAVES